MGNVFQMNAPKGHGRRGVAPWPSEQNEDRPAVGRGRSSYPKEVDSGLAMLIRHTIIIVVVHLALVRFAEQPVR